MEHDLGGPHVVTDANGGAVPRHGASVEDSATFEDSATVEDQGATAELDIDDAVLDAIEEQLADVERALALIDEGTYGQCEACGRTIDDAVLARTPAARFCVDHLPLALG
ncbi:MAG TPA: hypothetical protein VK283_07690 [Acidimicrobiales bacterium]|nr:hypothetical protein [Acidimicrobiales bacterium]